MDKSDIGQKKKKSIVLIGKESVGKSQLIRSLTGKNAQPEKLRGSTIHVQTYHTDQYRFIDTPGILLESDSITTQLALDQIPHTDHVIIVISATSIDQDLADLLPLVQNKQGTIIITHWDRVGSLINPTILQKLQTLEKETGVPIIPLDARTIPPQLKEKILSTLTHPHTFQNPTPQTRINITLKPKKGIFEIPLLGKIISIILLFLPAWLAVTLANSLADRAYNTVSQSLSSILTPINNLPAPISYILGGDYGIISMFPFLLLYALPTVILFSVIWSLYKTSGLIDRITVSLHYLITPFGLAGRDIIRVIMGYGCNVPAVTSTRTCSSCTRGNSISAITFGSACSYQLPATIAVFAAANMEYLVVPFLLILVISTLFYLRIITLTSRSKTTIKQKLTISERDFLQWPSPRAITAEFKNLIREFITVALPIFLLICIIAGALDWLGIIRILSSLLSPVMTLFKLPPEAATSIVLGSIRKDGIAIGLLNPSRNGLKIPIINPVQILTIVYLAGVLLPCLVTVMTVIREMNIRFTLKLLVRQMITALLFTLLIAWLGDIIYNIVI